MRDAASVLVVDDDRDNADSLALLLRLSGYEAAIAYDGETALEAVRARPPQAVLLDLAMPGLSGHELARGLRAQPGMGTALLVCVSGYGREEDRRLSREAGCDHHLLKPVETRELLAVRAAVRDGAAPAVP